MNQELEEKEIKETIEEVEVKEEKTEEININEILVVEQVPKIFEDLEKIGTYLDKTLEGIDEIECTESNKQEVKRKKAEINNTKTLLENKRKEIKAKIEEPYNIIESKYNEFVKNKLDTAIQTLSDKIDSIEDEQKSEIEEKCKNYFKEYAISKNIEFLKFENMNLKIVLGLVTSAGALTKKTQDTIREFIDRVRKDLDLIETLDFKDEILVEFKKTLACADSIALVQDRHKQLEEMKKQKEEQKEKQITDESMLNRIDKVLSAPTITVASNEPIMIETAFVIRVQDIECLKEIKEVCSKYNAQIISLVKEEGVYHD